MSSSSMSVHSLIDKHEERHPPTTRGTSEPAGRASGQQPGGSSLGQALPSTGGPSDSRGSAPPPASTSQQLRSPSVATPAGSGFRPVAVASTTTGPSTPRAGASGASGSQPSATPTNGLLALLGPNVTSFPYSEQAYVETIKLRAEQERTKQDYYKLEIASKNLSILQTALRAQIPAHMIPAMCVGGEIPPEVLQKQQAQAHAQAQAQAAQQPAYYASQDPSGVPIRRTSAQLNQPDALSASPLAPVQYRFGGGGGGSSEGGATTRPLSPAKIGAQAVANLATPTTPYRSAKRYGAHQRHYSMPAETLSATRSPGKSIDLNRIHEAASTPSSKFKNQPNLQAPSGPPAGLSSPQGATSHIYVKPAPAQPLQKQTKQGQQPSQESMTSLQHIIQFHHWKPEFPGQQQPGQQPAPGQSHKRHKSHSDNMSVDMTAPPPQPAKPEDSADVSMDTSMAEKDEKEVRSYPDILSNE